MATRSDRVNRPPDEKLLEALEAFGSTTEIAEFFGAHRSTVWRWLHSPSFVALRHAHASAIRAIAEASAEKYLRIAASVFEAEAVAAKSSTERVNAARELVRLALMGTDKPIAAAPLETADESSADAIAEALETVKRRRPELHAN